MTHLLSPIEVDISDSKGEVFSFKIGKIPWFPEGREVCTQFITSAIPKIGDYKLNFELARKLMRHVCIVKDGKEIRLATDSLVNNHLMDFTLNAKLETKALEHQLGFSIAGKIRSFRQGCQADVVQFITKMLTQLKASSPERDSVPDTNSEPSTP